MAINNLYTHDVTVQRITNTADIYGGSTAEYEAHLTSYNCRIYQPTSQMTVEDSGIIEGIAFKAIGEDADILVNDKIVNGDNEYIVKRKYLVFDKDSEHHLELVLDKIKWVI